MNRRNFVKKSVLASTAALAFPYILPTGRLFAATGSRIANHVVFCLFAGGIRNIESVQKAEGNLMPNLLAGNEAINADIVDAVQPLNTLLPQPLQQKATLFKNFRYNSPLAGHYQGNTVAMTGAYVNETDFSFSEYTRRPTLFEYYRKHSSPATSALQTWWVSNGIGENEKLAHSSDANYGSSFGANFISPNYVLYNYEAIDVCKTFSSSEQLKTNKLRTFLNNNFEKPLNASSIAADTYFSNTPENKTRIEAFLSQLIQKGKTGQYYESWGLPNALMNGDMYNVMLAEEVLRTFKPELCVVNMTETDVCHRNFSQYCNNLQKADYAAAHLWQTIQSIPEMANDTILIIAPEHGRDWEANSIVDEYGRYAIDHGGDDGSNEIFCMVAGPSDKVYQNNIINAIQGESIDIVPTIAHILGFYQDIPGGFLNGTPLYAAFK